MEKTMEKIVALAKARGFVYPGSEIYGGLANTWDYGNLGRSLAVAAHGLALLVIEGGMGRVEGELGAPKRAIACLKDANEQGTNI